MPATPASVVIVGGGVAALSTAESLRRRGYLGAITVVSEEDEYAYDRPPLSKQVLSGSWSEEKVRLLTQVRFEKLGAEWLLGTRAVALHDGRNEVELSCGRAVPFGALAIATGVRPRRLPGDDLDGVYRLRTLDDARRLRRALSEAARLTVVGGGFLGLEIAATATELGLEVTVVEPQVEPMVARLGAVASSRLVDLHRSRGVDLRVGVTVIAFREGRGAGAARRVGDVALSDGACVSSDAVVVATGSVPATAWLATSSLNTDDGVLCDEFLQAAPGVWAAGDVARWYQPSLGRHVRLEHRMNASEQGVAVAGNIVGELRPFNPVPYFWTDHYDVRIQVAGWFGHADSSDLRERELGKGAFAIESRSRSNQVLTGALTWNAPTVMTDYRRALRDGDAAVG